LGISSGVTALKRADALDLPSLPKLGVLEALAIRLDRLFVRLFVSSSVGQSEVAERVFVVDEKLIEKANWESMRFQVRRA